MDLLEPCALAAQVSRLEWLLVCRSGTSGPAASWLASSDECESRASPARSTAAASSPSIAASGIPRHSASGAMTSPKRFRRLKPPTRRNAAPCAISSGARSGALSPGLRSDHLEPCRRAPGGVQSNIPAFLQRPRPEPLGVQESESSGGRPNVGGRARRPREDGARPRSPIALGFGRRPDTFPPFGPLHLSGLQSGEPRRRGCSTALAGRASTSTLSFGLLRPVQPFEKRSFLVGVEPFAAQTSQQKGE